MKSKNNTKIMNFEVEQRMIFVFDEIQYFHRFTFNIEK